MAQRVKELVKKFQFIKNVFFSEVDIHDKNDLDIANNAIKVLKRNKKIESKYFNDYDKNTAISSFYL